MGERTENLIFNKNCKRSYSNKIAENSARMEVV